MCSSDLARPLATLNASFARLVTTELPTNHPLLLAATVALHGELLRLFFGNVANLALLFIRRTSLSHKKSDIGGRILGSRLDS